MTVTTISKRERMTLLRQGEQARMFYRFVCAAAPAALFVAVVVAGFAVLAH